MLGVPWGSHKTSLGPGFIISKERKSSYNLSPGDVVQGTADGSLGIQFVTHNDCLQKWRSKLPYAVGIHERLKVPEQDTDT